MGRTRRGTPAPPLETPVGWRKHTNESLRACVDVIGRNCCRLDLSSEFILSEYGPIEEWDVSEVTDMSHLFAFDGTFNADLSRWDVSNVTDMESMFHACVAFNADLSRWDVSNVTDMESMFHDCEAFNADLSRWDVSNVTKMGYMFHACEAFNADLSHWDVANVTDMGLMFAGCSAFNADLSQWNVAKVENMDFAFDDCHAFRRGHLPKHRDAHAALGDEKRKAAWNRWRRLADEKRWWWLSEIPARVQADVDRWLMRNELVEWIDAKATRRASVDWRMRVEGR